MGDNNKKTFADLFSDSASDVQNSVEENGLTFDSLFNNLSDDEVDTNAKKEVNFSDILSATSVDDEKVIADNKDDTLEKSSIDNNLFFKEGELEKKDSEELNDSNLFFSEDREEERGISLNGDKDDILEKSSIDNNLFFKEGELEKKDSEELNDSNLFFSEDKEEEKGISLNEDKDDTLEKSSIDNNLFFKEGELEKKDSEELNDSNLFFSEDKEEEKAISLNEDKDDILGKGNDEVLEKKDVVISSSPFFEEEVMDEKVNSLLPDAVLLEQKNNINFNNSKIEVDKVQHYNVKIVKKKPSLLKFIVGVVSYAIFIFLMLIGVTLLVYVLDIKIRASKGDYSTPTFNAYVVLTGSMLPDIQVKDVVITKKVDAELLNEGDIITFASADSRFLGTVITHRIIKKNVSKDGVITFQTKGDNNNVADNALVPSGNIYGKVILKIPKLGYLQDFLATQGGWIVVILIPCLAVISYDIVKLSKGLKKKKVRKVKVKK